MKIGIKPKIFLLGLILPIFALIFFAGYMLTETKELSLSGVHKATTLSNDAAIESRAALEEHGKRLIVFESRNRALFCHQALARISDLASLLALEASTVWRGQAVNTNEKAYLRTEQPATPGQESVIRIAPGSNTAAINKDISLAAHLNPFFRDAKIKNSIIKSIYIGTEAGLQFRMPWVSVHKKGYDPRKRIWYTEAVKNGQTGWTDLYTSASEGVLMITCSAPVYGAGGKIVGAIGIDVSLGTLNETLLQTSYEGGVGVLLDRNGNVVAHSEKGDALAAKFKAGKNMPGIREVFKNISTGQDGLIQTKLDGADTFIIYTPIAQTDWALCLLVPVESVNRIAVEIGEKILSAKDSTSSELTQQFAVTRDNALMVLALLLVVFLVIALRISRAIINPIRALADGTKVIGEGNFETKLDIRTGDELQALAENFNTMGDALLAYMKNLKKTTAEKERIQSELTIATDIQASMLPRIFPAFPDLESVDIFASMTPAKEVGGDFYDFFLLGEDKVCIVIADVSGKGVPAALFMVISKTLLQNCVRNQSDNLGEAITRMNADLCKDNDQMLFVTVFCAVIDLKTGHCEYVNGGHNPPVHIRGESVEYVPAKPVFPVCGVMEDMEYKSGSLHLELGDKLFLYTDGVTEAFNREQKLYGDERLLTVLKQCIAQPIEETVGSVTESIHHFAEGAEQSDDITMLFFEYKGEK
jgi:sigma-B regulation protein RsbU (phosphoserine phosphatase)